MRCNGGAGQHKAYAKETNIRKTNIYLNQNCSAWHDLRHTWASWRVQNGTSLQELQQLGGWSSFEMVLRCAHLSSDHLLSAANRISNMNVTSDLNCA